MLEKTEKRILHGIEDAIENAQSINAETLFSYSFQFQTTDLLPLLTHPADKNKTRIYWEQPYSKLSFAAIGNIKEFNINKFRLTVDEINKFFNQSVSVPKSPIVFPRIIGGISFNKEKPKHDAVWSRFAKNRFIIPECLGTMTEDGAWLTISTLINPKESKKQIYTRFKKLCDYYKNRLPIILKPLKPIKIKEYKNTPDKATYEKMVSNIISKIRPGKLEKVVLSRSQHIKMDQNFSPISAVSILRNIYPNCTNFFFSFPNEGIFLGSSPEKLIELKGKKLSTEALAGTIARGKNMEEDMLLGQTLLSSSKEHHEHNFVLEQILRKLKPISKTVDYQNLPDLLKLKNVQHLKTEIVADLKLKTHILDYIHLLHPTPAVAGTPTDKALEIINDVEEHDRGWYSGPIGWFNKEGDGEFYVALRSALILDDEAHVFVGGGIVAESIPQNEWEETELKLQPILDALSLGQL